MLRIRTFAAVVTWGLSMGSMPIARADEDEASIHIQALGGWARLEEGGAVATAPFAGLATRFTFAPWSDYVACEGIVALAQARETTYDDAEEVVRGQRTRGNVTRSTRLARFELGGHLRLGVAYVPTIHAGLGVQVRRRSPADFAGIRGAIPAEIGIDLTASLAAGLDYRLGRRWVLGAHVGGVHAFPLDGSPGFDAIELNLHAAAYWYPLW